MDSTIQPISWDWIKAVMGSSVLVLAATSGILYPVMRLLEPPGLARLPIWLRWALVIPVAFFMGLLAEVIPRMLFSLIEIAINHHLLFRPGVDSLIWQLYAPLLFVISGVQMAPAYRFITFLFLGGLKIVVAAVNLLTVIDFTNAGGRWSQLDPVTNSPLWWNSFIYLFCLSLLILFGVFLAKQSLHKRVQKPETV